MTYPDPGPPDSPERRKVDAALQRAQDRCPPEHRGDLPEVPCADCIRAADAEDE